MSGRGSRFVGMAVALALVAGGCGSASSTSTSHAKTVSGASGASGESGGSGATGNVIPPGSVAVAAGNPIAQTTLNHWMAVAAKSQAAQTPGQPAIVPTDPPAFKGCMAQVRQHIPSLKKTSDKTLKADCAQLFRSLSSQAMDFLIKADWIQADGTRLGVLPTNAQVTSTLNAQKAKQFPNGSGYQAFLAKTGQTQQDIVFRFRVNVILSRLTAREKGSTSAKAAAITRREKKLFQPRTRCSALVVMADCGNYHAG